MQIQFSINEIAKITNGTIIQEGFNTIIKKIVLDSRANSIASKDLFIAIKGHQHDAHNHLKQAWAKGARVFLIEHLPSSIDLPDSTIIQVESTLTALQNIAKTHRQKFKLPVIGITGSYGKTIIKEWFTEVCEEDKLIVKNPKSFNSQIGVPLSLLEINNENNLGVFEAGISLPNEMDKLAKIISPSIGVITNIGTAHESGFSSIHEKLTEKLKLFNSCTAILYPKNNLLITNKINTKYNKKTLISWAINNHSADYNFIFSPTDKTLTLKLNKKEEVYDTPFSSHPALDNICQVITLAKIVGLNQSQINTRIKKLQPLNMRLSIKQGINDSTLIDDSYSNDLASLSIALDFQERQSSGQKKVVILSDLAEQSGNKKELYETVNTLLEQQNIHLIIGIGENFIQQTACFKNSKIMSFLSVDDFNKNINTEIFTQKLILIKGARNFKFEKITKKLEYRANETVLEINLNALENNFNYLKSKLKPKTKTMAMVKAFSYGSGRHEVAQFLSHHRVDYLTVAYIDEGIALREKDIQTPIMVMNVRSGFEKLLAYNLEPEIYSLPQLKQLLKTSGKQEVKIHLKIDTGMHRLGFQEGNIKEALNFIIENKQVKVISIFSHLPSADIPEEDNFTLNQLETFNRLCTSIEKTLKYSCIKHILNSAGIQRFPKHQFDMVRMGIGLYGIGVNEKEQKNFTPVSTLKSVISSIQHVKKGARIGYGGTGIAKKDTQIATIAIGYGDGYDRRFGNGVGEIIIKGNTYRTIGRICMDMFMADIGDLEAAEGDEVILFSPELSVEKLATQIDTISYEILTNISERVKRTFYYE